MLSYWRGPLTHLKSGLPLCLMQSDERYHYWSVFAPGPSGVCIKFNRSELLAPVRKQPHVHTHAVRYMMLSAVRKKTLAVAELPVLKRHAYEHEDEFRIIYTSKTERLWLMAGDLPTGPFEHGQIHANLASGDFSWETLACPIGGRAALVR